VLDDCRNAVISACRYRGNNSDDKRGLAQFTDGIEQSAVRYAEYLAEFRLEGYSPVFEILFADVGNFLCRRAIPGCGLQAKGDDGLQIV